MVDNYEREVIIDALKRNRGNASAAARDLQTTQRIMNYKIRNLSIVPADYKPSSS
jgi:Nif-specific regulatory protein